MRVTFGQFRRRFVYNIKVGDKQVKRVMWNGQQVWPSDEDRVRTLALDMSLLEGSTDNAYWIHAMEATAAASSASCCLTVTIAGRKYCVNTGYNGYPVVKYSLGVLDFGEDGPLLEDVRVGDELGLKVVVPKRTHGVFSGAIFGETRSDSVGLPVLAGTQVVYDQACGRRKHWSHSRLTVTGFPSGEVLLQMGVDKQSRTWVTYRGTVERAAVADEGFEAVSSISGNGWMRNLRVVFPGFEKVFRVAVQGVNV